MKQKNFLIFILSLLIATLSVHAQQPKTTTLYGKDAKDSFGHNVAFSKDGKTMAIGAIQNDGVRKGSVSVYVQNGTTWERKGEDITGKYAGDIFGTCLGLSADGNTLAVGAPFNGENGANSGSVKIFIWNGTSWLQRGSDIKGLAGNLYGILISLNDDGTILAISSPLIANGTGQVKVYQWFMNDWYQKGMDLNGEAIGDYSGLSIALNADGNTIAIGAPYNSDGVYAIGHVRVYQWNGMAWLQKGIDLDGVDSDNKFGTDVSISEDGNTLAVGAPYNDSNGVNAGLVNVLKWNGTEWINKGEALLGDTAQRYFGSNVSLSANGNALAISCYFNSGSMEMGRGPIKVFDWSDTTWVQRGENIIDTSETNRSLVTLTLSADGKKMAVGIIESDVIATDAGKVIVYDWCSTLSTMDVAACYHYTSPSGKYTWYQNGTYIDTIPNAAGCDSIITIELKIKQSTSANAYVNSCKEYSSPSGKYSWVASGVYNDTIQNSIGCDSIITTYLTIQKPSAATINTSTCTSDYTSPSGKYIWTTSGIYSDTIKNVLGCDSILTIHLTINTATSSIQNISTCNSAYISPSGKYTWTTSGIYSDTIKNVLGCDSILTIHLTINTTTSSIQNIATCNSPYISPSGKYNWTTSGMYSDTIKNVAGCDSILTIHLTINTTTSSIQNITTCNSTYISPSGKYTWTTSGMYSDTIKNVSGCDSVITIALKIKQPTSANAYVNSCKNYLSPSGKYSWIASGIYNDTIQNSIGCDSIITTYLTIQKSSAATINTSVCASDYISPSGKYTWTKSGIYSDTIKNVLGCDSILTIHLTINATTSSIQNISTCNSAYISPSGKYTWTTSGVYIDTIPNAAGCDSIITIELKIKQSTSANAYVNSCKEYSSPSGKYRWVASGVYNDTIQNSIGCDSIITTYLTIQKPSATTINTSICTSDYTSPSGKYIWTTSGIYSDTIKNVLGCDSILTIHLTINTATSSIQNISTCNSAYISPSGKYTWTTSGMYSDTIKNVSGCDSILTINLTINSATSSIQNITTCNSAYISPSGKYTWTTSGIYKDTITNAAGCDSIITFNLLANKVKATISVMALAEGIALNTKTTASTYQWLNCDNNFEIIAGATNKTYYPKNNGEYAVEVTADGCKDTSTCIQAITTNIKASEWKDITIFPNPSSGEINIILGQLKDIDLKVVDVTGKLVYQASNINTTVYTLELNVLKGLYFVEINSKGETNRYKLIID